MKKVTALILTLLCTLILYGCRKDCISETAPPNDASDNFYETDIEVIPDETETETEYAPDFIADNYLGEIFDGIREMTDTYPDAVFYELSGLPDGYEDKSIEFSSVDNYMVYYSDGACTIAFMPCYSEDRLTDVMQGWLRSSGTYEYLLSNELVSNVRRTDIEASPWTAYECLHDTSIKCDLKLRYYEFTDEESGVTYILSENFDNDGSYRSGQLFVFDGESSFACGSTDDGIMTHETAFGFSAEIVE